MLFSIIVPVYKVEAYLKECVESVLTQTCKEFELILVDDGSPDSCPEICDQYALTDKRIKVIHQKNGGLVKARQAGMRLAAGEYIINLDSDDWLNSNHLEEAEKIIKSYHPDVISFSYDFCPDIGEKHRFYEELPEGYYDRKKMEDILFPVMLMNDSMKHSFYFLCGKVFRRSLIKDFQLSVDSRISYGEDVVCLIPVYLKAQSLFVTYKSTWNYRYRSESETNAFHLGKFEQFGHVIEGLEKTIKQYDNYPGLSTQLDRYVAFISLCILISAAASRADEQLRDIINYLKTQIFMEHIKRAEFGKITLKNRIVFSLLKKEKITFSYYLLKYSEKIKKFVKKI